MKPPLPKDRVLSHSVPAHVWIMGTYAALYAAALAVFLVGGFSVLKSRMLAFLLGSGQAFSWTLWAAIAAAILNLLFARSLSRQWRADIPVAWDDFTIKTSALGLLNAAVITLACFLYSADWGGL